jgi:protein-S-isoprenylcysteine O-methyltransferase Ste14
MAGAVELHARGGALGHAGSGARASRARALTVVGAARVDATPSFWLRARPPVLALALTIVALALHALVLGAAVPWAQSVPIGSALGLAGFGWMAWAHAALRRAGTSIAPTAMPRVLVDEGPYRFGRNPIYLGLLVTMLGLGVAAGVPLMAIAAANFAAIVASVHVPHEEANMQRTFGGWYSDYAASVRRWL